MRILRWDIPALFVFRNHMALCFWFVALTLLSTLMEMVSLGTIIPLFYVLFRQEDTSGYGEFVGWFYEIFRHFHREKLFVSLLVFFLIMTLIKVGLRIAGEVTKRVLDLRIQIDCQKLMYRKIIQSDLYFHIHNKSGDLIFRILQLPQEVSSYFQRLPALFIEVANVVFFALFLLVLSPRLFLGVVVLAIIYGIVISTMSKEVFQKMGEEFPKAMASQNIMANETVGGIREIIIHGRQESWIIQFIKECDRYYHLKLKTSILRIVPGNFLEVLITVGVCAAGLMYGLRDMSKFVQIIPILAVYIAALMRMVPSISNMGAARIQLATYLPSTKLFEKLLQEKTVYRQDGHELFTEMKEGIRFEGVWFAYEKGKNVLEDLNLTIPKNKTVAFVGRSGTGKTTLIDLMLGLYPVGHGCILIDGLDLNRFQSQSWRENIGIVSQNSFIFNATVRENIAFDFDEIDMAKVEAAARLAGAHEFVVKLQRGYDTELGDRGYTLSGGQRQRIAIARSLYQDPDIIIFDEATSALDNMTERIIQETLASLANKKTIIILAHRLSTIREADIIYVIKDKRVKQSGTHGELLAKNGEYSHLYQEEKV